MQWCERFSTTSLPTAPDDVAESHRRGAIHGGFCQYVHSAASTLQTPAGVHREHQNVDLDRLFAQNTAHMTTAFASHDFVEIPRTMLITHV